MTYSTELPEGFKTWNELKKKCILDEGVYCLFVSSVYPSSVSNSILYFEEHFIKSKCYDEIMELMGKAYDWGIPTEDQESDFVSDLEQLTHTKLFK